MDVRDWSPASLLTCSFTAGTKIVADCGAWLVERSLISPQVATLRSLLDSNGPQSCVCPSPWQQRSLTEQHEQEVLRGQQDVPWLRRQGSKNSRKLLYFVEWAQECGMSASFCLASVTLWRPTAWSWGDP